MTSDFTGTRFDTTLADNIPRLNGGAQYVSKGIQSGTSFGNDGKASTGSCMQIQVAAHLTCVEGFGSKLIQSATMERACPCVSACACTLHAAFA